MPIEGGQEIEHPDIDISPIKESSDWALTPPIYTQWLRFIAPRFKLDVNKLVLGYVLDRIWDDANAFAWTFGRAEFFNPETASQYREQLIKRLDWEMSVPEVPAEVRAKIQEEKEAMSKLDWSKWEDFEAARAIWTSIERFVMEQPELRETAKYYIRNQRRHDLNMKWEIFLKNQRSAIRKDSS